MNSPFRGTRCGCEEREARCIRQPRAKWQESSPQGMHFASPESPELRDRCLGAAAVEKFLSELSPFTVNLIDSFHVLHPGHFRQVPRPIYQQLGLFSGEFQKSYRNFILAGFGFCCTHSATPS